MPTPTDKFTVLASSPISLKVPISALLDTPMKNAYILLYIQSCAFLLVDHPELHNIDIMSMHVVYSIQIHDVSNW